MPSSGSITQVMPDLLSLLAPYSAIIPSSGRAFKIWLTMICSACWSIWVAKSTAELFSVKVKVAGRFIRCAPAAFATDSAIFNNSRLTRLSKHEKPRAERVWQIYPTD